jgi:hypothetical protein
MVMIPVRQRPIGENIKIFPFWIEVKTFSSKSLICPVIGIFAFLAYGFPDEIQRVVV